MNEQYIDCRGGMSVQPVNENDTVEEMVVVIG
jgi:hypothetical protein